MSRPKYLGYNVYVEQSHIGGGCVLSDHSENGFDRIWLQPAVIAEFLKWLKQHPRVTAAEKAGAK